MANVLLCPTYQSFPAVQGMLTARGDQVHFAPTLESVQDLPLDHRWKKAIQNIQSAVRRNQIDVVAAYSWGAIPAILALTGKFDGKLVLVDPSLEAVGGAERWAMWGKGAFGRAMEQDAASSGLTIGQALADLIPAGTTVLEASVRNAFPVRWQYSGGIKHAVIPTNHFFEGKEAQNAIVQSI